MRWEWTVVFLQCSLVSRITNCLPVNSLLQIDLENCNPSNGRIWKRPDPVSCGTEQCKFPMFCAVSPDDENDMECTKVTDACLTIIPINSLLEGAAEKVKPKEKVLLAKKLKGFKNANVHKKKVTVAAVNVSPSEEETLVGNADSSDHLSAASTPSSQQASKRVDDADVPMLSNVTSRVPKGMLDNVVKEDSDISDEVMDTETLSSRGSVNVSTERNDMDETVLDDGSGRMELTGGPSIGSPTSTEEVNAEANMTEEQLVPLTAPTKEESAASLSTAPSDGLHSTELPPDVGKEVVSTASLSLTTGSVTLSSESGKNETRLDRCLDGAAFCSFWAMMGECTRNPFWMKPNCQKSCRSCGMTVADVDKIESPGCQNNHELCQFWKSLKECEKNHVWMSVHCAASCDTCPPKI